MRKEFPSYCCDKHSGVEFVDVVEADGTIAALCPRCVPVELVDVVKQLHRRKGSS